MAARLYSAILNPRGPNYANWQHVLGPGQSEIPLLRPAEVKASLEPYKNFEPEANVPVYLVDLSRFTREQTDRLVVFLAQKFGAPPDEVKAEIARAGFPIRSVDVIVSFDMRAFV